MSIPRTAIHRPITMFMISGVLVILGAIALTRLPVDLMPDVSPTSLSIRVGYAGVGPLEIEELITRPIEESVSAIAGIDTISSTSSEGSSSVRLNFTWGTDIDEAADDVRARLDRVRGRLPEDADPPSIFKFDATQFPIIWFGVEGDYDPVTLRDLAENTLGPRFERVPGVAAVEVRGGLRRQIHVDLSREKIEALNLSVDRLVSLLRTENRDVPAGEIKQGDLSYLVRSIGQFGSLDDIKELVVQTSGTTPVYLKDIADVVDTTEEVRQIVRINGKPGIRLQVTKQSGTNTVQVADALRAEADRINNEVRGVRLSVLNDSSRYIRHSIAAVRDAALIGAVLVIAVIFVFLRDLRNTLIICTSIPISVLGTFALIYFFGFTLNTLTFGGLALGVGMIVDASIVVLENTFRHMERGKDRMTAAVEGSEEIWSAVVASVLTHVAVFVPLIFLTGVSSVMFKQLAAVVMFSLLVSLLVAVTVVPVLCSRLLRLPPPVSERRGIRGWLFTRSERALERVDDTYRSLLHRALAHRPTVVAISAGLFAAAIACIPLIGVELMPQADENEVTVNADTPVGSRIEATTRVALELERRVKEAVPEAVTIVTEAGGGGFMSIGGNRVTITARLVPKEERTRSSETIARDLRRLVQGIPGAQARTRASGGNYQMQRFFSTSGEARLALEIRGHDLQDAARLAQDARDLMMSTPGVVDVRIGRQEGRPELAMRVDRPKAALMGLAPSQIAETVQTNIAGTQAAFYRERGEQYPIIVRLRERDRSLVTQVENVPIRTPRGVVVPAKNIVTISAATGPTQIERKNKQRILMVNGEIETDLGRAIDAVEQRLPALNVPADFSAGFGAEFEEQQKSFQQLKLMLILAILLVYMVMASQYESLRDPFIIMFSVPVSAAGVVAALLFTGTTFSLQAYIGLIMLAGIVVSNAILLVDYTNVLRRRDGLPLREAVETAGRIRLRPILMTSLTTVLGLLPLAFEFGEGSELQAPLARVVIGGLVASTLITLVFVPTMYTLFEEGLSGLKLRQRREPVTERISQN